MLACTHGRRSSGGSDGSSTEEEKYFVYINSHTGSDFGLYMTINNQTGGERIPRELLEELVIIPIQSMFKSQSW